MGPFSAAPHHDVFLLLLQLGVLLAVARLLGELALRLGQPSVVGEISAGILLGPSLLSGVFPAFGAFIVPSSATQGYLLEVVSLIGAMFLLLITGLETDLPLIKRHLKTAAGVSFGGITVTFASGFALGMYLPDEFLARPDQRLVFALFIATAMSISAIPVIAKVLMDMNLMRRDIGQTILAAGMSDDTVGWIMLSIVAALASGQAVGGAEVGAAVVKVLLFLLLSFTIGRWLIRKSVEFAQDEMKSRDRLVTVVLVYTFLFGALSQILGLEAVLGAFVVGIILSQVRRLPSEVRHLLESTALGIFAPIFFGVAGLKVDIKALFDPKLALFAVLVILVACLGKFVGTYLGARLIGGKDHWTALSFGAGLNARGAMEIIIATIGLSLGILSQAMFSIIVVMAMVTSLMAPSALRYTLKRVKPSKEEMARLELEERAANSPLAGLHRILLPVRMRETGPGSVQKVKSAIYSLLARHTDLSLTLLSVVREGEREKAQIYLDQSEQLFHDDDIVKRIIEGAPPVEAILAEVKKDYQLLMLGAPETSGSEANDVLFNPVIDEIVRLATCPTLIFQSDEGLEPQSFRKILIPTNGSEYSVRAAEFAFKLAADSDIQLEFLNVLVRDDDSRRALLEDRTGQLEYELGRGQHLVANLIALAEKQKISCSGNVRIAKSVSTGILEASLKQNCDLIILGTNVRPGGDKLYLGQEVEKVLRAKSCPVIIMNR